MSQLDSSRIKLRKYSKKVGSTGDIVKMAAPKTASFIYNALRVGPRLILRSAFELFRANNVTRVLSALILISFDTFSLAKGRISKKQFVINVVLALMMLVGGTAGWVLGTEILSLLIENAVLSILAGLIGAGVLGTALGMLWDKIIHIFWRDDTEEMLEILNHEFLRLCHHHGLNQDEAEDLSQKIIVKDQLIKDIYAQADRHGFASSVLRHHFKEKEFEGNV